MFDQASSVLMGIGVGKRRLRRTSVPIHPGAGESAPATVIGEARHRGARDGHILFHAAAARSHGAIHTYRNAAAEDHDSGVIRRVEAKYTGVGLDEAYRRAWQTTIHPEDLRELLDRR